MSYANWDREAAAQRALKHADSSNAAQDDTIWSFAFGSNYQYALPSNSYPVSAGISANPARYIDESHIVSTASPFGCDPLVGGVLASVRFETFS